MTMMTAAGEGSMHDDMRYLTKNEFLSHHFDHKDLRVVFTGVSGTGKTTTSERIAGKSPEVRLIDIDNEIQKQFVSSGLVRQAITDMADALALNDALKFKLRSCFEKHRILPSAVVSFISEFDHEVAVLLENTFKSLAGEGLTSLAPMTLAFRFNEQASNEYSNREEALSVGAALCGLSDVIKPTLVSTTGSFAELSSQAHAIAKKNALFVHIKPEECDWPRLLEQAAGKPIVLREGMTLRELFERRVEFYELYSHVTLSCSEAAQIQSYDDLLEVMLCHMYGDEH